MRAGVDAIRTVLSTAKFQARALCLRHQSRENKLQTGCVLPKNMDLVSCLNSVLAPARIETETPPPKYIEFIKKALCDGYVKG